MMRTLSIAVFLILAIISCNNHETSSSVEESAPQNAVTDSVLIEQKDTFSRHKSSIGQMVYVPVYSHIYHWNQNRTLNLTSTLSIRNADPYRSLIISRVSYYDSKGNLVQQYIDSEVEVESLASISYVIEKGDLRGGLGANFLVTWKSEEPIIPPVIESVNISTSGQQGVSFLSVGRVLQERSSTD